MNIAIIPARGGSKRIPRKNIKRFLGKPIIAYSIEAALNSGLFDEVMVSTDDIEIAEIAKQYGAKVPFFRNKETANDYAGLAEVVIEVLNKYKEQKIVFDNVCCILATAPFIEKEDLKNSFEKLNKFDSVFPVVRYSFPIQRAMQFKDETINMIWPENMSKRSQDLQASFHDAGLFYWTKTDVIYRQKKLWTDNTTAIEIDESKAQDIDTENDWKMAELKYKMLNQ
ncbi:MAG: pseudaminic acid cytidylyltransferase [Bacteroidales bacterium]|nr:pseudaminic acid cytidylyltransferase [Bacteroidales bacterium]